MAYLICSNLVVGVRTHLRDERMEDRRQEVRKRNKIEERRRILQTELPPIYKKNYEDDMYLFYASQSGVTSRRSSSVWSLDSAYSQVPALPSVSRSTSLATEADVNDIHEVRQKQKAIIAAWRGKSNLLPHKEREEKPMKLLNYMNKYLERRKSQANVAIASLSSLHSEWMRFEHHKHFRNWVISRREVQHHF